MAAFANLFKILRGLVSFAIFCALRIVGMHLWKRWFIVQILGYIERSYRRWSNAGRYSIITIPISYSFFFSNWSSGLVRTHQPCFEGLSSRPWERSQRIFSLSGEGLTVVIFLRTKFRGFPTYRCGNHSNMACLLGYSRLSQIRFCWIVAIFASACIALGFEVYEHRNKFLFLR